MNETHSFNHLNIDLPRILREQWRAMAWAFASIMLIAVAYVLFIPKIYVSEAKLFVRVGRESVMLDPTATTGQVITVQEPRENEINSIYEMLQSRGLIERVVSTLGTGPVLESDSESLPSDESPAQQANLLGFLNFDLFTAQSDEETAYRRLTKKISVSVVKKTNVINISYAAASPEWAQHALTTYLDLAREAHIRANRTPGSQEFFTVQVQKLHDSLSGLEVRERDLKNHSGISDLENQRNMVLARIGTLESRLLTAEAERTTAAAQMEIWQRQLDTLGETMVTGETTGLVNTPVGRMREQLYTQEMREEELRSRLTEEHPAVIASRAQTAELREIVAHEPTDPQVTRGRNPTYDEIRLTLLKHQAIYAGLAAELAKLGEQRNQALADLTKMNGYEVQLAELQREIALEKANYKKYADNLEQARIDSELQLENISNLNVIEAPTLAHVPSRPKPLLALMLGCVAGLAAAAGVGLFRDTNRVRPPAAAPNASAGTGNGDVAVHSRGVFQTSEL